jgi:Ran GTPase-activating protein (RanGAP) involved in mRNA processing and transport
MQVGSDRDPISSKNEADLLLDEISSSILSGKNETGIVASYTCFFPEQVKRLADYIKALPNLSELTLCHNGEAINAEMPTLANSIKKCTNLNVLEISFNKIGANGMITLAPAIQELLQLKELNLMGNQIEDPGLIALSFVIGNCTKLSKLILSENKLNLRGMKSLATPLSNFKDLSRLDLSLNPIGDDGMAALAPSINKLKNLSILSLEDCNIGCKGAIILGMTLNELMEQVEEGDRVIWSHRVRLYIKDNPFLNDNQRHGLLAAVTKEITPKPKEAKLTYFYTEY